MKKIISLVLVVLTLCSLVVFPASAVETLTEGAYTYYIESGSDGRKYAVLKKADAAQLSGTVTVPETLGGYTVEKIVSPAYSRDTDISKVIIPGCVWYIGGYTFKGCTALTEVIILDGEKVGGVHSGAFDGCTKLQAIHLYDRNPNWYDADTKAKRHFPKNLERIDPVCSPFNKKDGNEAGVFCSGCNKYLEGGAVIPANHTDEKDKNGYCDRCNTLTCVHKCHLNLEGISAFFWKVELFFWKLFRMNKTCVCGVDHY